MQRVGRAGCSLQKCGRYPARTGIFKFSVIILIFDFHNSPALCSLISICAFLVHSALGSKAVVNMLSQRNVEFP